jgi:hypothetical protein
MYVMYARTVCSNVRLVVDPQLSKRSTVLPLSAPQLTGLNIALPRGEAHKLPPQYGDWLLAGRQRFESRQGLTHPASYAVDTGDSFLRIKQTEREAYTRLALMAMALLVFPLAA